ncbi:RNA polymerase factor sigma-54 [Cytobacillus sp. FSL W7-1323]|uniref:RNA polymerase factor sigma-54 n=1 Tax=Cytobacillus TaxID=2675230 RepID=UPI002783CC88|nr:MULTISPECIES: RNA polymerase factor sigma-54 [Cytobacillus]MDQ0186956.1 RNA polymerase sigma-54 factor [Cytobacillus kochii]MEA1855432.1 RNA polymerase factor sigma-54 [Cytobacillus sp. OWB-43]
MNLKAGLWQQQTLKLTMTQELTQAIALLQYNTQELSAFLESKALENPLMQIEASPAQAADSRFDRMKPSKQKVDDNKQDWIEQIGSKNHTTLQEYLHSQLAIAELNHMEYKLISYLIGCLDENGYLQTDIQTVAEKFNVSEEDMNEALIEIQSLEPAGVAARDLQECLWLQLERLHPYNEIAEKVISDYFLLFADKKWKEIAKNLKVELKEIQEVFDLVQTLNPRPAASFQNELAPYITPEVVIQWEDGTFSVSIYDDVLPKIRFNESYFRKFQADGDQEVNRFLQEKKTDFHWIARSIEQRKETLLKVALKIVEKQPEYFWKGPNYLQPMTMKEIADELEIHESTVSRAVREKYAQTPFGTIELRSFFSSTIKTTSFENASSEQAKNAISDMVKSEDKKKPLSDQVIVKRLEEEKGIVISRRTVAKYRDQLKIPSSSKRKRYE